MYRAWTALFIHDIDAEKPRELVSEGWTVNAEVKRPEALGSSTGTSPSPSCGEEIQAPISWDTIELEIERSSQEAMRKEGNHEVLYQNPAHDRGPVRTETFVRFCFSCFHPNVSPTQSALWSKFMGCLELTRQTLFSCRWRIAKQEGGRLWNQQVRWEIIGRLGRDHCASIALNQIPSPKWCKHMYVGTIKGLIVRARVR